MSVRPATEGDAAGLLPLYNVLAGEAPLGGEEAALAAMAHPGTQIWCQVIDNAPVSMATLHLLPNVTYAGRPYGLVENVATLPEFEGRGHGRAVITAVIDAAWEAGAYKIMLMTGRGRGAKGFYEKLGFRGDEKWGMTLRRSVGLS